MAGIGDSLVDAFDNVWERFTGRLEGLTDDEYFWEPVPDCWSLRRTADGRWRLDGGGGGGPSPEPAPFTTIAWRLGHVGGLALGGFASSFFGDGSLTVESIEFPPGATEATAFLQRHYGSWRRGMVALGNARWWQSLGEAWGPYAQSNAADLALHVLDEVVHHGAEISLLRDLYLRRSSLGSG